MSAAGPPEAVLPVTVAAVAYDLLGALWFTPLFGRAWDAAIGVPRRRGARFGPAYYLVPGAPTVVSEAPPTMTA